MRKKVKRILEIVAYVLGAIAVAIAVYGLLTAHW